MPQSHKFLLIVLQQQFLRKIMYINLNLHPNQSHANFILGWRNNISFKRFLVHQNCCRSIANADCKWLLNISKNFNFIFKIIVKGQSGTWQREIQGATYVCEHFASHWHRQSNCSVWYSLWDKWTITAPLKLMHLDDEHESGQSKSKFSQTFDLL